MGQSPTHVDVEGNEQVNILANNGRLMNPCTHLSHTPWQQDDGNTCHAESSDRGKREITVGVSRKNSLWAALLCTQDFVEDSLCPA